MAPVLLVVLLLLVLADVDDRVNVLAASILLMACFVCAINKCLISSVSISAVIRCFKQGSTRVPVKAKDQECHISDGIFKSSRSSTPTRNVYERLASDNASTSASSAHYSDNSELTFKPTIPQSSRAMTVRVTTLLQLFYSIN